jgi:hypothetical protein
MEFYGQQEMVSNFAITHLLSQVKVFSLPKKFVLWIFITLKNPLTLARSEPVNPVSSAELVTIKPLSQIIKERERINKFKISGNEAFCNSATKGILYISQ